MIENHQKMQEMSRRVENWINDAEMEIHTETFSDEEEDWGNSPPHLILLRIGMQRQIIHPSIFLSEGL